MTNTSLLKRISVITPLRGDIVVDSGNGWVKYKSGKFLINIRNIGFNKGDQVEKTKLHSYKYGILSIDIIHKSNNIIRLRKIFIRFERKIKLIKIDPSLYKFK